LDTLKPSSYYIRARYYSPANGRWTSEDPARDGTNWYVYCDNNPVTFVDPSGMRSVFATGYQGGSAATNAAIREQAAAGRQADMASAAARAADASSGGSSGSWGASSPNLSHSQVITPVRQIVSLFRSLGRILSGGSSGVQAGPRDILSVSPDDFFLGQHPRPTGISPDTALTPEQRAAGIVVMIQADGTQRMHQPGIIHTPVRDSIYQGLFVASAARGYSLAYRLARDAQRHSVDRMLQNKTYTNQTSGGVQNYVSPTRGSDAARADFNALRPSNVRVPQRGDGRLVGDLPDGRTVNIHPSTSSGGVPTVEVYNPNTGIRIKIRY